MNRLATLFVLFVFPMLFCALPIVPVRGATKDETASTATRDILRREAGGTILNRGTQLRGLVEACPDNKLARWQSGYVHDGKRWLQFDEVPRVDRANSKLQKYRAIRDRYPNTAKGHLDLANWCRKHGLEDQQRSHLVAVLDSVPDHTAIRARLGYRRFNGSWFTQSEWQAAQDAATRAARDLKLWIPRIKKIRDRLVSHVAVRRESAREDLMRITDPAAIVAAELVLGGHSKTLALTMIELLDVLPGRTAALGLARQSIFSHWKSVRAEAADCLKSRKLDDYVPPLLATVYSPFESRIELYRGRWGNLLYKHMFLREGKEQRELLSFNVRFQPSAVRRGPRIPRNVRTRQAARSRNDISRTINDLAWQRQRIAEQRQRIAEEQNVVIAETNSRVYAALTTATGLKLPAQPDKLWKWWNQFNEVSFDEPKRVIEVTESATIATPPVQVSCECLAAGTPVWTDTGLVPIEQIKVADRVLAKHPETGELAYKPVLKTTVRAAAPLFNIDLGDDAFRSTGAHRFWVSGKGWTRTRDLKPEMSLHTVSGTARVLTVATADPEPTYNLIVADFHTYFVGGSQSLSHDITIARPTDILIPGLSVGSIHSR